MRRPIRRRTVVGGLSGTLALMGGGPVAGMVVGQDDGQTGETGDGLRHGAAAAGVAYGSAVRADALENDQEFVAALIRECAIIVPENALKWGVLSPHPGRYEFGKADRIVGLAAEHGLMTRGHTLVWHRTLPSWLDFTEGPDALARHLKRHIRTVVGRYRNRVRCWDVVNEPLASDPWDGDGLRREPWLEGLGRDYIARSLTMAAAADSGARLAINDFGLVEDSDYARKRRQILKDLVDSVLDAGAPLHAIGAQCHLTLDGYPLAVDEVRALADWLDHRGIEFMVTELNVDDRAGPSDLNHRDHLVAQRYRELMAVLEPIRNLTVVVTWGLSDRYSWLRYEQEGREPRALPLDGELNRKPAWAALAEGFGAMKRYRGG